MFRCQNKQVTTKFQSAKQNVSSGANQSTNMKPRATTTRATAAKVANGEKKLTTATTRTTTTTTTRSAHKLSAASVQAAPRIQVKPCLNSASSKLAGKSDGSNATAVGSRKAKIFRHQDNISSRMRIIAGALPRAAQWHNNRIYRPSSSKIFDYDLSKQEARFYGQFRTPMKSVPADELQLLRSGNRSSYLETRYGHTPDVKYNYPEATSWRYGWFHQVNVTAK
ncbi:PREDICTED: uncharacterized protein LOC108617101 [Drosophila arizonae]|uniref:Uncharacterized protein LOC108617101 n=1 Tax=Drosophila arizonae TaxID=7263 RepID=A0ABM1PM23_DROAR|nr:PREDICTED: uncharacterized protein LOC108617101 [Drosophila arizonae]